METDPNRLSIARVIGDSALDKTKVLHKRVTVLYDTHRNGLFRFLLAQGIPAAAAQEITQDVFVKLFIALRDGVEIVSERSWLYSVAAKSSVDLWRREKNATWVVLNVDMGIAESLTSKDPSPETMAIRTQKLRLVANALGRLPKEQRMCLQLRCEGLRYREIATILGVAVSTTAEWLATAVERLRGAVHD